MGVFPEWKYKDSTLQFAAGDRLLLFTDGITEAANGEGEEFGEDRLVNAANTVRDNNPSALQEFLLSQVKHFCNSQLQDDATLIVVAAHAAASRSLPDVRIQSHDGL